MRDVVALGPPERYGKWIARVAAPLVILAAGLLVGNLLTHQHDMVAASRQQTTTTVAAHTAEEAFAAQFVTAYLTFDESDQSAYAPAVAPYLGQGVDPNMLWDGQGSQTVTQTQVEGWRSTGNGYDIVTVAAFTGKWVTVAVPVHQDGGSFVVTATPALVPGLHKASWAGPGAAPAQDGSLSTVLHADIKAFFVAYAASDGAQLAYYTTGSVGGLNGAATLKSLNTLSVYQGGSTRQAVADVTWSEGGGSLDQRYDLTLVKQGGKWLVQSIQPSNGGQ